MTGLALDIKATTNPYTDLITQRFYGNLIQRPLMFVQECDCATGSGPDDIGKLLAHTNINRIDRWQTLGGQTTIWAMGDELLLMAYKAPSNPNRMVVTLGGSSDELVTHVRAELLDALAPPVVVADTHVDVRFWYLTSQGPQCHIRSLTAPSWDEIDRNYSAPARKALDRLITARSSDLGAGKLILLHGEPGTGKTTAVRALAKSWKPWCTTEYVVDPEKFFGEAAYMVSVLIQSGDNPNTVKYDDEGEPIPSDDWRLIIVEDAEEFVRPGSKAEVGQSVARLLNLSDGLIGQGLQVLVLLTTNVPIIELHPAMKRPGRCLANIEVPELTGGEASRWLSVTTNRTRSVGAASLAELYALAEEVPVLGDGITDQTQGTYL